MATGIVWVEGITLSSTRGTGRDLDAALEADASGEVCRLGELVTLWNQGVLPTLLETNPSSPVSVRYEDFPSRDGEEYIFHLPLAIGEQVDYPRPKILVSFSGVMWWVGRDLRPE